MRTIMLAIPVLAGIFGTVGSAYATTPWVRPSAMPASYLAIAETEMTVITQTADLREQPEPGAKVLDKLTRGTKVMVLETVKSQEWAHVKVNNKEGYILSRDLSTYPK